MADKTKWHPWFLTALTLLLLLPGNNVIPLIDRDEPRFAQATREMMERNDWVIPTFNGEDRFDKPVLTYWLMRGAYAIFGVNEFGARFHSVASAVLLVLAIYFMGRRWFSARAAFWAALGMATCLQMLIHGRSSVADMPMVLFVTLAQWALWELVGRAGPARHGPLSQRALPWILLLYVSLGLGFLAKGPIAIIVPALTLLLYRFAFARQPLPWSRLKLHLGIPLMLLIVGAWGIPALAQTQGRFWQVGIGEHVVERGTKAFNKRLFLPIYYPLTFFLSLFPWCVFVRTGYRTVRQNGSPLNAFLMSWFVAPYIVFMLYATQLPHYVMPAFPAFFLLLGQAAPMLEKRRKLIAAWAVVMILLIPALGLYLRPRTPAIQFLPLYKEMPARAEFACWKFREPSLVFYSNRRWKILKTAEDAQAFLDRSGPRLLVAPETDTAGLVLSSNIESRTVSGINVAKSQWVTVRALYRR
ncbi:MAG: glycosyltransferase family 39 protein [bacterium]